MKVTELFRKPVDRPIEGVIKADDNDHLIDEVDEYVLTNETEKRLEEFLDAYCNYQGANGAWISGFFGSGKSHLLKMVSLLLANESVNGKPVADTFVEKARESKNAILEAAIQNAVSFPSKSILFNIDQKADVISKSEIDALLSVFVKVFDESCGYYGKQGYIAEFERVLDEDGLLTSFKEEFVESTSKEWDWARMRVNRFASEIDDAYAKATGQKVAGILDRYRADYKVSIEDFAEKVDAYIKKQDAKDFRLNFFVDEVGQYIADNTKLMTNLQTIAESLATKSNGQAWIIVTAQEDMNTVVGEMGKQQGNDFSKIQARFANRMPLTSKDVAEVIQRRLLSKDEQGEAILVPIYKDQVNNFKTLFGFSDGSIQYRSYQSQEHFINCYPFVPYQFELFQSSIRNLSERNAFTGKHSSVGERSMLGVFQDVAKKLSETDVPGLATFDRMFEGLRSALKGQIQSAILTAERNLDNDLAIRLLKALFMVKYVREFKPTLHNLSILMLDTFDQDQLDLRKRVETALHVLENQVYIQRNGDHYEFLTDEEKDVEQEIKNTEIDTNDIAEELSRIVFDQVLKTKKLRHEETKHDYPFTRKLDDRSYGRTHELSIHIVSPFHDDYQQLDQIKVRVMGQPELLVVLPADDRLFRDIQLYKQTEKYIRQNVSLTQQESVKRILTDKAFSNKERQAELVENLRTAVGKAALFVDNREVESSSEDPSTRIHVGFEALVRQHYTHLPMLRGIQYTESNIERCLKGDDDSLFQGDATVMSEAETEMLSYIGRRSQQGLTISIKQVVEDFEKKPCGWYPAAIQCVLAKLCGRGKVEARSDGKVLEDAKLVAAIKNTRTHGNVLLEPQIEFTANQVRRVKEFYNDFFDKPPHSSEAKSLGAECAKRFQELHAELSGLSEKVSTYPFLAALEDSLSTAANLGKKSFKYFFTEFEAESESLLDLKEDVLDPIRRFMSGTQANLYSDAKRFLGQNETNFTYVEGEEHQRLGEILADPKCYSGSGMQSVKTLMTSLQTKVDEKLDEVRKQAEYEICEKSKKLQSVSGFDTLASERSEEVQAQINAAKQLVRENSSIAYVKDATRRFDEEQYPTLLGRVTQWTQAVDPPAEYQTGDGIKDNPAPSPSPGTKPEFTSIRSIRVDVSQPWLANEQDVDMYLAELRAAMLRELAENKRIQI